MYTEFTKIIHSGTKFRIQNLFEITQTNIMVPLGNTTQQMRKQHIISQVHYITYMYTEFTEIIQQWHQIRKTKTYSKLRKRTQWFHSGTPHNNA